MKWTAVSDYKNELFTLKRQIEILLSYIEDKDMRLRRVKELNGYATYTRDGILMEIPEHYFPFKTLHFCNVLAVGKLVSN